MNAGAVMPSYNEIDGIPCHANRWMLHDVLREEWGFQGAIVSDYFAIREMVTRHRMFANRRGRGGGGDQRRRRRRDCRTARPIYSCPRSSARAG